MKYSTLILFLVIPVFVFAGQSGRKLDVTFLFHFNQDLVPYAIPANEASYKPLTRSLLELENIPFAFQISGTLLHNLLWHDPESIENLKTMVHRGQAEPFGSTYSQNVMVASGIDWLNRMQIDLHAEVYRNVFQTDITPGFWNPERVWKQDLVTLISGSGFRYVPVEQHILQQSGISPTDRSVLLTRYGADSLLVIHDDAGLRFHFNHAINTGDTTQLISYLRKLYELDRENTFLAGYFDDAEAVGLWQYEGGIHPDTTRNRFVKVMKKLQSIPWLNITTPSEFISRKDFRYREVPQIITGEAAWMLERVANFGYKSWFDYRDLDKVQRYFDDLFAPIRDSMQTSRDLFEKNLMNDAIVVLFDRMQLTFAVHEYEYGASWEWNKEDGSYNMVREALIPLRAMRHVLQPADTVYSADINNDGFEEVILSNHHHFLVFTPLGGRLLYWFDLKTGRSYIGNENFNYYGEHYSPGNPFEPDLTGGTTAYNWLSMNPLIPEIFDHVFRIRRSGLADIMEDSLMLRRWDVSLSGASVKMTLEGEDYAVDKTIWIGDEGPVVEYRIDNLSKRRFSGEFFVLNTLSPALPELMDGGRDVLVADGLRVENRRAGTSAQMEFSAGAWNHTGRRVVFGWETESRHRVDLRPNQSWSFQIKFKINE